MVISGAALIRAARMYNPRKPISGLWELSDALKKGKAFISNRNGRLAVGVWRGESYTLYNNVIARYLQVIVNALEKQGLLLEPNKEVQLSFENMSAGEVRDFFRKLVRLEEVDLAVIAPQEKERILERLSFDDMVFRSERLSFDNPVYPGKATIFHVGVLNATAAVRIFLNDCIGEDNNEVNKAGAVTSISPDNIQKLRRKLQEKGIDIPTNPNASDAIVKEATRFREAQIAVFPVLTKVSNVLYLAQFDAPGKWDFIDSKLLRPDMGIVLVTT